MIKENCLFCNYNLIKEDILWESENFFVKVGVGILAPGHVMMVSKNHLSCFGELPKNLFKEFSNFKEELFNSIKSNFSEPLIYEQGAYGQSVEHAHLHILPMKTDYFNLINIGDKILRDLKSTKIDDIFQIIDIFGKYGSYMYLEENGNKQIFHTLGIKKGYTFRKEIAMHTGLHGLAFWQNMDEKEKQRNNEWIKITKEALNRDVKY